MAASINVTKYYFSMSEIATVFTGYVESRVHAPKLFKILVKEITERFRCSFPSMCRTNETTPKTAVSLLYSYSRAYKQRQIQLSEKVSVNALHKVIMTGIDSFSVLVFCDRAGFRRATACSCCRRTTTWSTTTSARSCPSLAR